MTRKVHFLPEDVTVTVEEGENLLAAAAAAGVFVNANCGGDGVCGKCRVRIEEGNVGGASAILKQGDLAQGFRLACQSTVQSDLVVRIPEDEKAGRRALKRRPQTTRAVSGRSMETLVGTWQVAPPLRKVFLQLIPPTIEDNISDLDRLQRALQKAQRVEDREFSFDHPELLRELSFTLREADWAVTVLLLHGKREEDLDRIIAVEPGDTTAELYGLAVDIGTTTVCGLLVDLNTGQIIAEASAYNEQIAYGDDVISRIIYAARAGGAKRLQAKVVRTINHIIETVCREVMISPSDISYIMSAGNTTMSHLLLGLSPKFIREAPYVPTCSLFPLTRAAGLGVLAHPSVRLFAYPCPASYVGGDIVSGVHACQMHKSTEVTLFIDIGTNGEIVIGNKDWMVCAACSAGPAFEGGGIRHGMRASSGAIDNVAIHPETFEPMVLTIDRVKPVGICGSGLIGMVAEMLEAGVIDQRGKFNRALATNRIRPGEDGYEYLIVEAENSGIGKDIVLTEVDLDNLLRAKGAMYAGYQTLLESVGMGFESLDRVVLAGNFGAYLDLERAITIGLLPDLPREKFFYVGNGSLLGCQISLTDHRRFRERSAVRKLFTHMELSENPQFMNHYMASLFLPHTDMTAFPTVQERLPEL